MPLFSRQRAVRPFPIRFPEPVPPMRPAERLELAQIGEEVALYEPRPSPGAGPLNGLVSVITPAHNASAVIVRAIEAVATQTVGVLEHIIIDDGSRDDTSVLVQSLQEHHPHIRY